MKSHQIAIFLFLALLGLPSEGQEESWATGQEGWSIRNERLSHELGLQERIAIRNDFGDVRVRGAGEGWPLQISAVIQRQEHDPYVASVVVEEVGDVLDVRVVYQLEEGHIDEGGSLLESIKRRADLTVILPKDPPLTIRSAGIIQAKGGLRNDVDLETDNGDITIDTAGRIQLRTLHGQVVAFMRATDWPQPSTFESKSGEMILWFPPDGEAQVEARTAGNITTDYSVTIERLGKDQRHKIARAKVGEGGEGGAKVLAESAIGAIKLLRNHI